MQLKGIKSRIIGKHWISHNLIEWCEALDFATYLCCACVTVEKCLIWVFMLFGWKNQLQYRRMFCFKCQYCCGLCQQKWFTITKCPSPKFCTKCSTYTYPYSEVNFTTPPLLLCSPRIFYFIYITLINWLIQNIVVNKQKLQQIRYGGNEFIPLGWHFVLAYTYTHSINTPSQPLNH